ncbi:MAG: RNA polymerase sigma factor [Ignavibacteriae bacterium]|nr:RNA polymerase sigma factor [Ignavibacteriota bacterium]MCB9216402.1 RNA polymerase sigma factor [Ignavibacteria bacterium]
MTESDIHTKKKKPYAAEERDEDLFSAFLQGDELAFGKLYEAYEKPLFLYCKYLLSAQQDAEEVFQETWMRVVRMRRRGKEVEHFRAFLFTVARNTGLKFIERRKRRQGNVSIDAVDPAGEWMLQDNSQYSELKELVNRALTRVPVMQREAFVLHSMLGYTFDEIAEMQGVSMTAAKTRAFRARHSLRKLLANWLGMLEDEDPIGSGEREE